MPGLAEDDDFGREARLLAESLAPRLIEVPGVLAVTLGGSVARGRGRPDSDLDLGLVYDGSVGLDVPALARLCRVLDDENMAVPTEPGGWGPWVDGGAWLTVAGRRVDLIYREVSRITASVDDAVAGRVTLHTQVGHPHGIHGHHYAAELACAVVLLDPGNLLAPLRRRLKDYPDALRSALIGHYGWQPHFWLDAAQKGLRRQDVHYAQGCAFQAVTALMQVVCAHHRIWVTNEKGLVELVSDHLRGFGHFGANVHDALAALDLVSLRRLADDIMADVSRET